MNQTYIEKFERAWEARNIRAINRKARLMEEILERAAKDIAATIHRFSLKHLEATYSGSFYQFNRQVEKNINTVLAELRKNVKLATESGMVEHWELANAKNNEFVKNYVGESRLPAGLLTSMNQVNITAMKTFIARQEAGMSLSRRVWKLSHAYKAQVESFLASGITTGKSAIEIAKDLQKYILGKPIKYKGALLPRRNIAYQAIRLAANEANIAYRMSDYERRQKLPFVVGIEVHLSNAHPEWDICDSMAGNYPKTFVFSGWHPRCICYSTSILSSDEQFEKFLETGQMDRRLYTRSIPQNARGYLDRHKEQIERLTSKPYFVRDNFTDNMELKKNILQME